MYLLTGSSIQCLKAVKFVLDCIIFVMVKIVAFIRVCRPITDNLRGNMLIDSLVLVGHEDKSISQTA
jgi:hypothetical protein